MQKHDEMTLVNASANKCAFEQNSRDPCFVRAGLTKAAASKSRCRFKSRDVVSPGFGGLMSPIDPKMRGAPPAL